MKLWQCQEYGVQIFNIGNCIEAPTVPARQGQRAGSAEDRDLQQSETCRPQRGD